MSVENWIAFLLSYAGAPAGVFVGLLIGLSVRARGGNREGLLAGSVPLTALAGAAMSLGVVILVKSVS